MLKQGTNGPNYARIAPSLLQFDGRQICVSTAFPEHLSTVRG
jgi:hypothetical protein